MKINPTLTLVLYPSGHKSLRERKLFRSLHFKGRVRVGMGYFWSKKRNLLALTISLLFSFPLGAFAEGESFDDFRKEGQEYVEQETQEFNQYMAQLQKEFDDYKRIVDEL